jgi:ribonuclease HI
LFRPTTEESYWFVPVHLRLTQHLTEQSVIRALEICPFPDLPLEIRTDSQYTIMCMTTYLPGWLKNGFLTSSRSSGGKGKEKVKNTDMIKHLLVLLRRRKPHAPVRFKYVPGHAGVEGNEGADVSWIAVHSRGRAADGAAIGEDGRDHARVTG